MRAKEAYMQTVMQDPQSEVKQIINYNTNTMSELKVTGKIEELLPVESGVSKAGKDWKKQNFVVNTGDEYNPLVCFSVFGDEKVANLANNKVGETVEVAFNVSSRKWEKDGKVSYFHNLDAWKINVVGGNISNEPAGVGQSDDDSLPF